MIALTSVVLAGCSGAPPADQPPFARAVRGPDPAAAAPAPEAPAAPAAELQAVTLEPGPDLVGLCDASAAVAVGQRLVVADDEHNVLRVFDWAASAAPLPSIDLTKLSPQFEGDEADLEGIAALPDGTVWLTGSHDPGKGTERKPSRQRLFALRIAGDASSATLAHGPTAGLIDVGQEQRQLQGIVGNTVGRTAKDPEGLSIEGLAAGPAGSLVFGFRAPIHGGKALVERLEDPVAFAGGAEPRFTGPKWIDLGGRGIRSLEADGHDGFLLIAGPAAEEEAPFALYRWKGFDDGAAPERISVAFGDLNPEALVRIGEAWWVLSDDGGRKIDGAGKDCKKLPEAQRRARTARLVGI